MPFIGKAPETGAFRLIDSITTSATDTYALTVQGDHYFPASARNLIVSLNGVTQAPESAYTVSGSHIVFASALTANDVIDYILVIGDAVDIGTPSDGTVGTAQMSYPLDNFSSTGIDDNATETAITIDANENVEITKQYASLKFNGETTTATLTTSNGVFDAGFSLENDQNSNGVSLKNDGSVALYSSNGTAAFPDMSIATNGNIAMTADLRVDTNTLIVDSTNNSVGIGTSPDTDVKLTVADSGTAFMRLRSTDASGDAIFQLGNATDTNQARVVFLGADESLNFYTSDAKRVTVDSNGNVLINETDSSISGEQVGTSARFKLTGSAGSTSLSNTGNEIAFSRASANYISATNSGASIVYSAGSGGSGAHYWRVGQTTTNNMILDSSGNLGLNTSTADSKLDVRGTIFAGESAPSYGQIALGVHYGGSNNVPNTYGTMKSTAATCIGWGVYGSPTVTEGFVSSVDTSLNFRRGALLVDQNELRFLNAGQQTVARDAAVTMTERFKVAADGKVKVMAGNLVIANGYGIDFSAWNNTAGMTSEVLDDYEEGTWTPVFTGTTSGTLNGTGTYTKVGRMVTAKVSLYTAISSGTLSGNLKVTGFPFAATGTFTSGLLHIRAASSTGTGAVPFGLLNSTVLYLHDSANLGNTNAYQSQAPSFSATKILQNGISTVIIDWGFSYYTA